MPGVPVVLRLLLALTLSLWLAGCAAPLPLPPASFFLSPTQSELGRQVQQLSARQPGGHSGLRLLPGSAEAFTLRARLIRAAERSLDIQYYLVEDGLTTRLLLAELLAAADRGVRVRVLLDDTASDGEDALLATLASHPQIEVRLFNPVQAGRSTAVTRLLARFVQLPRQHRRMHNKLLLVDGSLAIIGGRNLGDEYFAMDRTFNFADLDLLAAGPVALQLAVGFDQYWNHRLSAPVEWLAPAPLPAALVEARRRLQAALEQAQAERPRRYRTLTAYRQAPPLAPDGLSLHWAPAEALWDHPDKLLARGVAPAGQLLGTRLLPRLQAVETDLVLVSAYFVPTPWGLDYLVGRARAGTRVRVLTNSLEATDVPAAHGGYAPYRHRLLAAGVELHEMRPQPGADSDYSFSGDSLSSLHSKAMVLDGRWVFIGSPNADPRSVLWNSEVGILIDDSELAGQVRTLLLEGMVPGVSYQVRRQGGQLQWVAEEGGEQRVLAREPGSAWRRLHAWLADVLGLEPML